MQHPERAQGWGFQTAPLSLCNQKITQKKKQHRCSSLFTVFSKVNSPIFFFNMGLHPNFSSQNIEEEHIYYRILLSNKSTI